MESDESEGRILMTTIGNKAVGSIVKLRENGSPVEYLVVHQGNPNTSIYHNSCDGTWLVRKEVEIKIPFFSGGSNNHLNNVFASSDIFKWLNTTMLQKYDSSLQSSIKNVLIPHVLDAENSIVHIGSQGLSCKLFLLSGSELGFRKDSDEPNVPSDGAKLDYFDYGNNLLSSGEKRKVRLGRYFTRSGELKGYSSVFLVDVLGLIATDFPWNDYYIRPAMIVPTTLLVDDNGIVVANVAPSVPSTITLPDTVYGGKSCAISWSASSDPDGNLEGYIVERSYDGGSSWAQIYQGAVTNTSTTIPFGTGTVMVRVCAYDTLGAKSGWRTSATKTVINNRLPVAPASISVPLAPAGGQNLTITWAAASDPDGNLAGYELERQWDGAGIFTQIYRGAALSHQDNIPKGTHTSVVYRVRSYDAMGAFSGYTTSPSRTIDNNTAPVIQCDLSGDLGIKSDGFSVSYTITDAENQIVTVTEKVGNLVKRTYKPTLNQKNTFDITGEYFQKILNGKNTITITAQDTGGKTSVLSLTFTKKVHKAVISLSESLPSESQIQVCVLSVTGDIPSDATYTIEVTNNGNDTEPVWEDATADIKLGRNHVFSNQTQTSGWAFNFRVTAERGQSGESAQGGYIASIQGGFQ